MRGDILNGLDVSRMASKLAKREQKPSEDHRFKVVLSSNDGKTCTIMVGNNQVEADTGVAVYPNDIVTARWRNGRYTVTSNLTKPSVNDSDYEEVKDIAQTANELLNGVAEVAEQADKTLDDIIADAVAASRLLDGVETVADQADKTLAEIIEDAAEAGTNAAIAKTQAELASSLAEAANNSAIEANGHAVGALNSLSTVQDVVGTLAWISEHGGFALTTDASPQEAKDYFVRSVKEYVPTEDNVLVQGKQYFTRSGTGEENDPYVYTLVGTPDVSDIADYYEAVYQYSPATVPNCYFPTADESIVEGKQYWEDQGAYSLTEDSTVQSGKDYYTQHFVTVYVKTTDTTVQSVNYYELVDGQYVLVQNPTAEGLPNYYVEGTATEYRKVEEPSDSSIATYFERAEASGAYLSGLYSLVEEPAAEDLAYYYEFAPNPSALGFYEFTGELDSTVQNYIASHLSLTDEGLWVTKDGQGCHLLIANDRLSFRGLDGQEVAYIAVDERGESTFYMTRSVVVKDLKFGKWMWFERSNRNMALKWVG